MQKKRWLKKYTKLKFLEGILESRSLHLGNPECWEDKNDSELMKRYVEQQGLCAVRATCLTRAPDRFHFWSIFGEAELGVCLWFESTLLEAAIKKDQTLVGRDVTYPPMRELKNESRAVDDWPFLKREQYRDEKEFRVLRTYPHGKEPPVADSFTFPANSLKRIYLNAWLSEPAREKAKIYSILGDRFPGVVVCQNRVLRKQGWINLVVNGPAKGGVQSGG